MCVHAHRTDRVSASEVREGTNKVGGGIRVGGEKGDENGVRGRKGDVNGYWDGDGDGRRTGVEVNKGTQDGIGDGSGDEVGRVKERRICATKSSRAADVMITGKTWAEEEKQTARKQGGKRKALRAQV